MAVENLTDAQIEARMRMLEERIASADLKDLPTLNLCFQRLMDEQVKRDLEREELCQEI